MRETTIIKPAIAECFENFMTKDRVLFLSAPCGFGKTTLAEALLSDRPALRLSAADADFALPPADGDWSILLLDDLQQLQDEGSWQALCELIRNGAERRFLLLSRGVPPGCLMAFQWNVERYHTAQAPAGACLQEPNGQRSVRSSRAADPQ